MSMLRLVKAFAPWLLEMMLMLGGPDSILAVPLHTWWQLARYHLSESLLMYRMVVICVLCTVEGVYNEAL